MDGEIDGKTSGRNEMIQFEAGDGERGREGG